MPTPQGDVALLNDPVAQSLLQSKHLAHLAYVWSDGTPRVVPIWFTWTGTQIVVAGSPDSPRTHILRDGAPVALEIDTDGFPDKVLLIRGTVQMDTVNGVAPEWARAAERYMGTEAAQAFVTQAGPLFPEQVRFAITPTWVAILDFEQRFPQSMAKAMERAQAQAS